MKIPKIESLVKKLTPVGIIYLCAMLLIGCAGQKLAAANTPAALSGLTPMKAAYPAITAAYPLPVPGALPTLYPVQLPLSTAAPTQTKTTQPTPEPLPPVQPETLYQVIQRGNLSSLYSDCLKTGQPESPIFVQGLDGAPDSYYLVYRRDGIICLVAVLGYQAGSWTVRMHTADFKGSSYPAIRAEDAAAYIEKQTCQKTKGQPVLGEDMFGNLAWRVIGVDGIVYDVYSAVGQTEAYTPNALQVWAVKQGDDRRHWLQPSGCG